MKVISQIIDTELKKEALRVAFATSDSQTINEHFGWADSFLVYDVSKTGYSKVGMIKFSAHPEAAECNPENKHFEKIKALGSCHIIYSQSIGGPAAARLTQNKIHPIVVKDNPPIMSILGNLKSVLNGPVPPWVRKLTRPENRMEFNA